MNGVLRTATGRMSLCDEVGCEQVAGVVVGPRHLCVHHAYEESQCWKALAHLGLRPMSKDEELARREQS
jgi:hypothetical protein